MTRTDSDRVKELTAILDRYEEAYDYPLPWWRWREKRDRYVIRFVVKDLRMTALKIYDPWPWGDLPNDYNLRAGDDIS
jgi:hypothetical protein